MVSEIKLQASNFRPTERLKYSAQLFGTQLTKMSTTASQSGVELNPVLPPVQSLLHDPDNIGFVQYAELLNCVKRGDWNSTKNYLELHPEAVRARITYSGQTALHVAIEANHSDIVEPLVAMMQEKDLEIIDFQGKTTLYSAIVVGNWQMTQCLVQKNKNLVSIGCFATKTLPVFTAIMCGHKEMTRYVYKHTSLEDLKPEKGDNGASALSAAIYTRNVDIALHLMKVCPRLAFTQDKEKTSPLFALAIMPELFPSGNRHGGWKQWFYSSIRIQLPGAPTDEFVLDIQDNQEKSTSTGSAVQVLLRLVSSSLYNLLGFKDLYQMKVLHAQYSHLLSQMCNEIPHLNLQQRMNGGVVAALFRAIEEGIFEYVYEMVKTNKDLLWCVDDCNRTIFACAVLNRRAKIFSLIYGLKEKNALLNMTDKYFNNVLHQAGTLETASTTVDRIPGAALQMQRELQWFKEVERIVDPRLKSGLNNQRLTPRKWFTKNHQALKEKGEAWMKDTATSCTVVGALIITIMFAAAFTVPGGNDQNTGKPLFINKKLFKLFIISDSLSLFSSSTSVLMFLGILTSRYSEEDFLKSLPKKMIIGLSTLFFSIANMMVAFSAAIIIMLSSQLWITIPIIVLAGIPVTLFVLMQFRLLIDMVKSTYGSGIFDRNMKPWL
ncbi:hypothetical protein CJ030_MR0G006087 [Morella rubra]|uniref:PGG domain-containing protein n=1 Tax=Morella rubra TaxID=262757 RepID=A0A6A1UM44_9ROSI|nr:hypothetical protein CJ030_MR0G006087 [Morella rubra]